MAAGPRTEGFADDPLGAPSSLMSSRWSRDNLITGHPARLYNGKVVDRIGPEALEQLIQELRAKRGPFQVGPGRMGVYTWDIACNDDDGRFILQVPLVLDEPGRRGRAKRDVPRLSVDNMRAFAARGLGRFVVGAKDFVTLDSGVPVAILEAPPDHHPLTFGRGSLHVELTEGRLSWVVSLGPTPTADLLSEMIAALVYHYDPDTDGGTALTDVSVNDGDFVACRRPDGAFDVRLTAARRLEGGIGPSLLLLYLVQLMAYEDWSMSDGLVGLPVLISNPSVAFEGVVRGLRHRYRDLGRPEGSGAVEARRWIEAFGGSREGRAYRPWVDCFLAGRLPPAFGGDLRERWWRLIPLQTKLSVLELRARGGSGAAIEASAARTLRAFLDRLSRDIGRLPEDEPGTVAINDVGRVGIVDLLREADARASTEACESLAEALLAHWPFRSLDHLLARVPAARSLRRLKSRIVFGRVLPDGEQGTLRSLGPPPQQETSGTPETPRALANHEVYGGWIVPGPLQARAAATFPTFEAYMDASLHDPAWGYYSRNVSIGSDGHFNTNPEDLSPHYGRWLATWAFRCWRDLVARGELTEEDAFPVIEFGAGNGRLARDFVDAAARNAERGVEGWRVFAARLAYRIYETSASLREKQRALLGTAAQGVTIAEGDARRPRDTLSRDFPNGVRGLVLTNEVPDAFGVHKVVLTAEGQAFAALVVPRIEAAARGAFDEVLARRIAGVDATLRETFGFRAHPDDLYLDGTTFSAVMESLAGVAPERREVLLGALWFEEGYVSASAVPALAAHLAANVGQYATALAAEGSGVVTYVNVHAGRFIGELGASLKAGAIITIDYGDTTWGLIQGARRGDFPFRVYGAWEDYHPRPNDPYAAPGTQDLTADVNFTDLAAAGRAAGLHLIHYGPERDLIGDELPEVLRAAEEDQAVTEFLGNPVFKVLVLGTRASDLFTGPLMSGTPVEQAERDLPKTRREKIPAIRRQLLSARDSNTMPP